MMSLEYTTEMAAPHQFYALAVQYNLRYRLVPPRGGILLDRHQAYHRPTSMRTASYRLFPGNNAAE